MNLTVRIQAGLIAQENIFVEGAKRGRSRPKNSPLNPTNAHSYFTLCYKYTKPPECVDIIRHTSRGFTAGALKARVRRTSAFMAPAGKTE